MLGALEWDYRAPYAISYVCYLLRSKASCGFDAIP